MPFHKGADKIFFLLPSHESLKLLKHFWTLGGLIKISQKVLQCLLYFLYFTSRTIENKILPAELTEVNSLAVNSKKLLRTILSLSTSVLHHLWFVKFVIFIKVLIFFLIIAINRIADKLKAGQ